uniref:Protein-serine/threonine phosphatase n=1 Tax=Spermophilus dauricus TaxID=99837 RepID=A0A8C9Q3B7_SPEDA
MAGDRLPRKVMDAKKLASLLRGGPGGPLVIDSRSFVEYNSWHVLSSVNICCSKLVKRRLQQGKVTIAELIQPAVEATEPQDVVVYDQSTRDASVLAADSFLSILLSKLDGCFDSVDLMTQNGISYVLNASNSCPKPDFICESHFLRIPINDNYCEKLLPWLDKSIEFIDKAKLSSCQVIVHCLAGISRSATIAIAYIMKTMGMSSDDAYRYCTPPGFQVLELSNLWPTAFPPFPSPPTASPEAWRSSRCLDPSVGSPRPSAVLSTPGSAASSRTQYKYILYIMQRKVNGFTAIFIEK